MNIARGHKHQSQETRLTHKVMLSTNNQKKKCDLAFTQGNKGSHHACFIPAHS